MASPVRKRSNSGFYHVVQRGVNRFDIFEDDADRSYYLKTLQETAQMYQVEIHAWCLMSNHTHLLLRADRDSLVAVMRRLGSIYAKYFNCTHGRRGPLFEGRYRSVCVETEEQLIAVVRYIHRNPIVHEATALVGDYAWSSYREYLNGEERTCVIGMALGLFGGIAEMARIHSEEWPFERHLDIDAAGRMSDDEARSMANAILESAGIRVGVAEIGALSHDARNEAIALVKRAIACPLRQLRRLTAISLSTLRAAVEGSDADITAKMVAIDSPDPAIAFVRRLRDSDESEDMRGDRSIVAHNLKLSPLGQFGVAFGVASTRLTPWVRPALC